MDIARSTPSNSRGRRTMERSVQREVGALADIGGGGGFSGPGVETNSLWATSDADLKSMGEVNWKRKECLEVSVGERVAPITQGEGYGPIIAESELAIERVGFSEWTPVGEGELRRL